MAADPGGFLQTQLARWAEVCPLPLVLIFDEIDAVAGPSLRSILSQLRTGFDDRPAACVAALNAADDCGIYLVATAPWARRRGLALGLMRQALRDARERGASTSSLQATQMGAPVYERLGYGDHGAIDMWERREA